MDIFIYESILWPLSASKCLKWLSESEFCNDNIDNKMGEILQCWKSIFH